MRDSPRTKLWLIGILVCSLLTGCSRDPNVRKQKYLESGQRYFQKGKYREAAIQFQNALQVDPRYVDAHYQLAQCSLKLGIMQGAYAQLLRTVDLEPRHWKAQIDLGNMFLAGREFKRAQEKAELVLAQEPNNAGAHALLANSLAAQGNQQESLKEMQKAIELAPNRSEFYQNVALLQMNLKQTSAAEESYKKAVSLDPKSAAPVLALGDFYGQQRRFAEAEQQFRRAIELEPKNPAPRATLARLYLFQGQKDKAEEVLKEAKRALKDNSEGYRMLGDFYLSSGEVDKAIAEYASLYQEHPQDLRVKKNYVQLLILRNRLDEATKLNDEILKKNPKDVDGLICRGQILTRQGRGSDAMQALESAVKTDAENAAAHHYLGVACAQVGNLQRAETEWREAARLRPDMVEAQQALAAVALRKGDVDLLSRSAEELIKVQPFSPLGYNYRAIAKAVRKDLPGVEADLKKAIEVAPQSPLGYTRLGELRISQGRTGEGRRLLEQALEHDPNALEALLGLVRLYSIQKQPTKALDRVNAQIAKAPNNSAYYLLLGQMLAGQKDLEKAEAALQKAVELNKDNIEAMLLLGRIQVARGSQDRALANYQQSIQRNPRDVRSYVLLGTLEERRGNWQKAQELYQKALQVQPDYPVAANNLAYLTLEHGGNADVALSLAQIARRGMPDLPSVADTLAWAYYQKGAYASAIDLLNEAVKQDPQNPTFHYHLGLAYQKTNDRARAREHLERTLKIDPNYSRAAEIKKALAELSGS